MFAKVFKKEVPEKGASTEGASGYEVKNQCQTCAHYWKEAGGKCDAFPNGIPFVILLGKYDHTFEFNFGGVSDEGVTYSKDPFLDI